MSRSDVARRASAAGAVLLLSLSACSDEKKEVAKSQAPIAPAPSEAPTPAPVDRAAASLEHADSGETLPQTPAPHDQGHWTYEGASGPTNWGALSPEFAICSTGTSQSPIDISHVQFTNLAPLQVNYEDVPLQVENNGHTLQVNYPAGSTLTIGDSQYELVQFHFHSPSEHTLGGHAFDMVAHLVHKNATGGLAVIAAMLKVGNEHGLVKTIWENAPAPDARGNNGGIIINAGAMLPREVSRYFHYSGSLTTPPCAEGVQWFVLANPSEVSQEQVARFREWFPLSTRPVQPVNGRPVLATN